MSQKPVHLERHGATAVIRMTSPRSRNALSAAMREGLAGAIETVRTDAAIKAVVLTGSDGCFCAGGDIKGMGSNAAGERDVFEGRARILAMHRWLEDLADLEKPLIAAVDGPAFGAGLSLTLTADYVLAGPRAVFCAVFARIGYVPDLACMYLLPRIVGLRAAKDLVLSAREIDAGEAVGLGLAQTIVEGDLDAAALDLAARFHAAPTNAIGMAKRIMNRAFESDRASILEQEAMAQAICRESAFHREAAARFLTRKPPAYRWSGR